MKKFFAKLMNWQAQRGNNAERIYEADQKDQAELARGRLEQIMKGRGDKKYLSEKTIPAGEVRRPDDSVVEKSGE